MCGNELYICISTTFGSTIMNLRSSGVILYRSESIMEFMHTLLPLPVEPAISACGIFARSSTMGTPVISLPSATGISARLSFHSRDSMISLTRTMLRTLFGISMPTVPWPGIGAIILTFSARMPRAMSSSRLAILFSRTPVSGRTS